MQTTILSAHVLSTHNNNQKDNNNTTTTTNIPKPPISISVELNHKQLIASSQVWQAIEKVLLEDALGHPQQSSQQGSEETHFTQLAPACPNPLHLSSTSSEHLHLQIQEDEQQQQPYMEANTDGCKVDRQQILRIFHLSWSMTLS